MGVLSGQVLVYYIIVVKYAAQNMLKIKMSSTARTSAHHRTDNIGIFCISNVLKEG